MWIWIYDRGEEKIMGQYTVILWDIDGTILNFLAAEKAAIKRGFQEFKIGECTDEMLADYSQINKKYWEMLERKEMTKQEILFGRFYEFFEKYGIDRELAKEFQPWYQLALGDTIVFEAGAQELLKEFQGKVKQYAVTNGTKIAQTKKLDLSGLDQIFDAVFISEDVGVEKPSVEFFQYVFDQTGITEADRDKVIIIGDSLTSDIKGGNNIGIDTCWYNPKGLCKPDDISVTYEIKDISEIKKIIFL